MRIQTRTPDLPSVKSAKAAPRAMIAGKQHIQDCIASMLEQFGYITRKYSTHERFEDLLSGFAPDIFLLWLCDDTAIEGVPTIKGLAREGYAGNVFLVVEQACPALANAQALGEALGLRMMPTLFTPLCDKTLWSAVRDFCDADLNLPEVDLITALNSNWLEMWYQPKFDIRTFRIVGAEALVRMRHPKWGIIEPNRFVPAASEKGLIALSDFAVGQAMADWHHFAVDYGDLEMAVNIPMSVLTRSVGIQNLIRELPLDHRFHRALIETDAADVIDNPGAAKCIATELTHHHLALSLDDVGADWVELCAIDDAPVAEIKVDRSLISGCAKSVSKQAVCKRIIEFARRIELSTVAEGVETRADLMAAREIGFDLVQGFICGRPVDRNRFGSLLRERWGTSPGYLEAA